MNVKNMDKITNHFCRYFKQQDCLVLHPIVELNYHVDVLLFKPNEEYPFWKLATMGASDYKMPRIQRTVGRFNEYIMFVDKDVNLEDKETVLWYANKLTMIASYAYYNKCHITVGHSMEWENEGDDEMVAAFIDMPQIIEDTRILHCKLGAFKTVGCLQTVLLNQSELETLMKVGPYSFSNYLYPDYVERRPHFLSERKRSDKF